MRIECKQDELKYALAVVAKVAPTRTYTPILEHVLFEMKHDRVFLSCTDLEKSFTIPVAASAEELGGFTVPARKLSEFVASLPNGNVEIELKDGSSRVTVKCNNITARFPVMPADEFPLVKKDLDGIAVPAEKLLGAFDYVIPFAARDFAMQALQGISVACDGNRIALAGADGFRLGFVRLNLDVALSNQDIIIPVDALALSKFLDRNGMAIVEITESSIAISDGLAILGCPLIDGAYPDVARVIPDSFATRVVVDRKELQAAVRRSLIFAGDATIVNFAIGENTISVSAESQDGKSSTPVDAEIDGPPIDIAANGKYVVDALSTAKTDNVFVGLNTSTTPIAIKEIDGDIDWVHVLMPMALDARRSS